MRGGRCKSRSRRCSSSGSRCKSRSGRCSSSGVEVAVAVGVAVAVAVAVAVGVGVWVEVGVGSVPITTFGSIRSDCPFSLDHPDSLIGP